jgi:hypothetical protein
MPMIGLTVSEVDQVHDFCILSFYDYSLTMATLVLQSHALKTWDAHEAASRSQAHGKRFQYSTEEGELEIYALLNLNIDYLA